MAVASNLTPLSLADAARVVWRRKLVAAAAAALVLVTALVLVSRQETVYESEATVAFLRERFAILEDGWRRDKPPCIYLALNGRYFEAYKHMQTILAGLEIVPERLNERLAACYTGELEQDWQMMNGLIEDTLPLVQRAIPKLDLAGLRDEYSYERARFSSPPDHEVTEGE